MATITTGRPIDQAGDPTDGPALEMDPDGAAANAFSTSSYSLASSPGAEMWSAIDQWPARDDSAVPAMLVWLGPDAMELPPHVHTRGTEYFHTLEGEVTLVVDGETRRLGPQESVSIEPGQEHFFRNDSDEYAAFYVETPWFETIEIQFTVFGMDHDGAFSRDGSYGQPGFLQGLVMSEYLREGTHITAAPFALQRLLWATVAPVGRALGRQPVDERYLEDEFWERTVEQPDP